MVHLVTVDSWFIKLSEKLKYKCFQELATVKFHPELNLKSTGETTRDIEKVQGSSDKKQTLKEVASYYLNIAEELNDFDEWCISEQGVWGVPIPYFTYKDSDKVLCDAEIARHFASLVRTNGGSDCWYRLSLNELLPVRYKELAPKLIKGV
jgi:isoleucyl-tRNA synthetase